MSITAGYRVPGNPRGQAFTLPDFCWGKIGFDDACRIAESLRRAAGREPHWQTVRGKLIRLAKSKGGAA